MSQTSAERLSMPPRITSDVFHGSTSRLPAGLAAADWNDEAAVSEDSNHREVDLDRVGIDTGSVTGTDPSSFLDTSGLGLPDEITSVRNAMTLDGDSTTHDGQGTINKMNWPFPPRPDLCNTKPTAACRSQVGITAISRGSNTAPRQGHVNSERLLAEQVGYGLWNGNHPEDVLSDQAVKSGYSIKSQLVNEQTHAYQSIRPHLKSRAGSENLSLLLKALLREKRERTKVTNISTFKYPPRVTLTDQKREAWLKDLANLSIPLRKQSRTIPHGVRNKTLLEQCLSKRISMRRAVWLAKCVGANELRALKRKGVSNSIVHENELKWIEAWTIQVELFIEEHCRVSVERDWKRDLTYILQLTTRFFAEGLLDVDHYLNWIIDRVTSSSIDELPITLFLAQLNESYLTTYINFGQRIASACLLRLKDLYVIEEAESLEQLCHRLELFIVSLLNISPACFILPEHWSKVNTSFQTMIQRLQLQQPVSPVVNDHHAKMLRLMEKAVMRNDRLALPLLRSTTPCPIPSIKIVNVLDFADYHAPLSELADELRTVMSDTKFLVKIVFTWASSIFRAGTSRIYLISRLLRLWSESNPDEVALSILSAIDYLRESTIIAPIVVGTLVADLIRSGSFYVAQYLRSLIGSIGSKQIAPVDYEILVHMPAQGLASNLLSLRTMILRAANVPVKDTGDELRRIKSHLEHYMEENLDRNDIGYMCTSSTDLPYLNTFQTLTLSHWTTQKLSNILSRSTDEDQRTIDDSQMRAILQIVSTVHDPVEMYPVLQGFASLADMDSLCLISGYFEAKVETFGALGLSVGFWLLLFRSYRTLRQTHAPNKDVCQTLLRSIHCIKNNSDIEVYLQTEVTYYEANQGLAAYTPLSEGQGDTSQFLGDDLEAALSAGHSLEPAQLSTVLDMLLVLLGESNKVYEAQRTVVNSTLQALKAANGNVFSKTLLLCLSRRILAGDNQNNSTMISILLNNKCLQLKDLLNCIDLELGEDMNPRVWRPQLALLVLEFLYGEDNTTVCATSRTRTDFSTSERLTTQWARRRYASEASNAQFQALLQLHSSCLKMAREDELYPKLVSLIGSAAFRDSFHKLVLYHIDDVQGCLDCLDMRSQTQVWSGAHRLALSLLLSKNDNIDVAAIFTTRTDTIRSLFNHVDATTLPFDQLALRLLCRSDEDEHITLAAIQECIQHIGVTGLRHTLLWPRLLLRLQPSVAGRIRKVCENRIILSKSPHASLTSVFATINPDQADKYALVIEHLNYSICRNEFESVGHSIVGNLLAACHWIEQGAMDNLPHFETWLKAMVKIAVIHHYSCSSPQNLPTVCYALCRLLTDMRVRLESNLHELAFDTASYFASMLDQRQKNAICDKIGSPQRELLFLLGSFGTQTQTFQFISANPGTSSTNEHSSSAKASAWATPIRQWELLPEATPNIGANDTALSLTLFDAYKEPNSRNVSAIG